jgi:hypothetical protein
MKNLTVVRPLGVLIMPRQAAGMLKMQSKVATRIREPCASHKGPTMSRAAIVEPTPAMFEVQMSCLVSLRSSEMYGSSGTMENQTKTAMK